MLNDLALLYLLMAFRFINFAFSWQYKLTFRRFCKFSEISYIMHSNTGWISSFEGPLPPLFSTDCSLMNTDHVNSKSAFIFC